VKTSRVLVAGAALFITLVCWSLSAPINSHQDEKFQFASILCANGNNSKCRFVVINRNVDSPVFLTVNLCTPKNTTDTKFKRILVSRAPNKCRFEKTPNDPLEEMTYSPNFFFETTSQIVTYTSYGIYPKLYFQFLKSFETQDAEKSLVIFRIVNSALFAILLTLFLLTSSQNLRNSLLLGLFVTLIPHGLFLGSGINNSNWTYVGCCLSWGFLFQFLSRPFRLDWKTIGAIFGWIISGFMAITSRYDSIPILLLTNFLVLVVKIITDTRRPKIYLSFIFSIHSILFMCLWLAFPRVRQLILPNDSQPFNPFNLLIIFGNAIKLFIATPLRVFGLQAPGWEPLEASRLVFFTNLVFFGLVFALIFRQRSKTLDFYMYCMIGTLFGVYLIQCYVRRDWTTPFYLIRTSWSDDSFRARYFIPFFPFIIGVMALYSRNFVRVFSEAKFRSALITVLGLSNAVTLYDLGDTFRENPNWYWQQFAIGVNSVFFVGVVAFVLFLSYVLSPSHVHKKVSHE